MWCWPGHRSRTSRGSSVSSSPRRRQAKQQARAFSERKSWRKDDRDPEASPAVAKAQTIAIKSWGEQKKGERYGRLKEIKQPTLVFNGTDDVMIPTINSYILAQHLPDARLVLYPDSGHGALFQYPDQFCAEVKALLA